MSIQAIEDNVLVRAVNKAKWRIIPCLIIMYLMSYLDRVNVSFAKSAYQASTGISDAAFAFGAGIFFISYAVFELPSNLLMHRVGPRLWLVRIMVTWGLVSAAMSFAWNEQTFYLLRVLLGVVEAGFFPTAIYFIAQWFPLPISGAYYGDLLFRVTDCADCRRPHFRPAAGSSRPGGAGKGGRLCLRSKGWALPCSAWCCGFSCITRRRRLSG